MDRRGQQKTLINYPLCDEFKVGVSFFHEVIALSLFDVVSALVPYHEITILFFVLKIRT